MVKSAKKTAACGCVAANVSDYFGENVFNTKTMRKYLSNRAYRSLLSTIVSGKNLDAGISDEVADAMMTWALSKGVTHYTHWFQPQKIVGMHSVAPFGDSLMNAGLVGSQPV